MAARSAPDGYTILVSSSALVISPLLYREVTYDPEKDFQAITKLVSYSLRLVVHPSLPVQSVRDLIALAKAKPGQINCASSGIGSPSHLAPELLKRMAMVDIAHIPYKGLAPAMIDLIAGRVSIGFFTMSAAGAHIKSGKLRVLAITGPRRSAASPDLPTISESVPGYEIVPWFGAVVQTGTPNDIVNRLNIKIVKILHLRDVKERLVGLDYDIVGNTPAQFSSEMKSEIPKWAKIIKDSGAKAD